MINMLVWPNDTIIIHVKLGEYIVAPHVTKVISVHRGTLVVANADSSNGMAKIVCHGISKEQGHYWYEYEDRKLKEGQTLHIVKLQLGNFDSDPIRTNRFIED
jgi:hypothetical protein